MSFPLDHPIVTDGNHHRTTYGTGTHPAGSKRLVDTFSGDEKSKYHFLNEVSKFVFLKKFLNSVFVMHGVFSNIKIQYLNPN